MFMMMQNIGSFLSSYIIDVLANQDNVSEEGAAYIVDLFVFTIALLQFFTLFLHCNTIDISLGLFGNVLSLLRLLLQLLWLVIATTQKK